MTKSATEKQINWIADLLSKKVWNDENVIARSYVVRAAALNIAITWALESPSPEVSAVATAAEVGDRVNQILAHVEPGADDPQAWRRFDVKGASKMIDWLRALPFKSDAPVPAPVAPVAPVARVELEDGMYLVDGNYYKVQHAVHGSGNQYAKIAIIESVPGSEGAGSDTWTVRFDYARGAIAKIRPEHKLSYEQAKEFGMIYGTCCRCGKTLTDELSIHLGIGPVCGGREFGGDFKAILKAAKLELKKAS